MNGEKPVLASDWDDVNYAFIEFWLPYFNQINQTSFKPEDIYQHDLSEVLGLENSKIMNLIDQFHDEAESVEHGLLPSVEQVIPVLAETYDIVIVTARKKQFKHRVQDSVDRYIGGSIAEIYMLEDYRELGHNKGSFVRDLGAVALVDDHTKNVDLAVGNGVRGLLMTMPKNIYYDGPAERVSDWYDVYEKLTGRAFNSSSRPSETVGQ